MYDLINSLLSVLFKKTFCFSAMMKVYDDNSHKIQEDIGCYLHKINTFLKLFNYPEINCNMRWHGTHWGFTHITTGIPTSERPACSSSIYTEPQHFVSKPCDHAADMIPQSMNANAPTVSQDRTRPLLNNSGHCFENCTGSRSGWRYNYLS